jgi:hypothetical protein
MSAIAAAAQSHLIVEHPDAVTVEPVPGPAEAFVARRRRLHEQMLNAGWSLSDIDAVESLALAAHLSATYLAAGYSPDEVQTIISLCC